MQRCSVILLALLAFTPRLFAAGDPDSSWSKLSARVVVGHRGVAGECELRGEEQFAFELSGIRAGCGR